MFKGVLGGFLTGAILSALVLGTASVLTEIPTPPPPRAGEVELPAGSAFNQPLEDRDPALPGTESAPETGELSTVEAPEPDTLTAGDADTDPSAKPETGDVTAGLAAPETADETSGMAVDSDAPVLPSPQTLAPESPEDESELSISTDPAQPVEPETETAAFPEDEAADAEPAEDMAEDSASEDSAAEAAAPEDEGTQDATPQAEATEAETTAQAPETAETDEATGTIGDLAEGVTTNRLPSVGDTAVDTAATEDTAAAPPQRPIEAFAADFDNPERKPLMAIVLIDDGQSPIGFDALADFPYPISYAIDASWSGAPEAAAKYRAAGLEVLAMANLPAGAGAADTEVAMQTFLGAVPEAVAIMEGTGTGLQPSREATAQLIPILQESGHGLVLFPNGLDTAQKLIAREGVPAASVFRDFDAKGQNATVIRRFLDQAAFKAGTTDGGVIMVGRLKAETVSALLLWGLQDRANSVALAPVSAVLLAGQE